MKQYRVTGMSCAACSSRVEKAVSALDGVSACSVNLLTGSLAVEGSVSEERILSAVREAGYGASPAGGAQKPSAKAADRSGPIAFFYITPQQAFCKQSFKNSPLLATI